MCRSAAILTWCLLFIFGSASATVVKSLDGLHSLGQPISASDASPLLLSAPEQSTRQVSLIHYVSEDLQIGLRVEGPVVGPAHLVIEAYGDFDAPNETAEIAVEGTPIGTLVGDGGGSCVSVSVEFAIPASLMAQAASDGVVEVAVDLADTVDPLCSHSKIDATLRYLPSVDIIDFGEVFAGQTAARQIELRNLGPTSVSVDPPSVEPADGIEFALPSSVAPGELVASTIEYTPSALGSLDARVRLSSSAWNQPPLEFRLVGQVVSPPTVSLDPAEVKFVDDGSMPPPVSISVSNDGGADLIADVAIAPGVGASAVCRTPRIAFLDASRSQLVALDPSTDEIEPLAGTDATGLVVDPVAQIGWGLGGFDLQRIDLTTGDVRFVTSLPYVNAFVADPGGDGVLWHDYGGWLYHTDGEGQTSSLGFVGSALTMASYLGQSKIYAISNGIREIDLETLDVRTLYQRPGINSYDKLAVTEDRIYAAGDRELIILDRVSGALILRVEMDLYPDGIVVSEGTIFIIRGSYYGGVYEVDPVEGTFTVVHSGSAPREPQLLHVPGCRLGDLEVVPSEVRVAPDHEGELVVSMRRREIATIAPGTRLVVTTNVPGEETVVAPVSVVPAEPAVPRIRRCAGRHEFRSTALDDSSIPRTHHDFSFGAGVVVSGELEVSAPGSTSPSPSTAVTAYVNGIVVGSMWKNPEVLCGSTTDRWPLGPHVIETLQDGAADVFVRDSSGGECPPGEYNVRLTVDIVEDPVDFGEVPTDASATLDVEFENTGWTDLIIASIHSDSPEFTVDRSDAVLAPGGRVAIPVRFTPSVVGQVEAQVSMSTNDPEQPEVEFTVHGTGFSPARIAVQPESLHLALRPGQSVVRMLTLANTGSAPLDWNAETFIRPEDATTWPETAIPDAVEPLPDLPLPAGCLLADRDRNAIYLYAQRGSLPVPFYRYDVAEHAWTRLADAPVGAYSRCAMAMQGDRLFVLFNIQRDMLLYDILTDSWLRYSSNPTGDQTGTVNMAGDGQSIYLAPGSRLVRWDPVQFLSEERTAPPFVMQDGALTSLPARLIANRGQAGEFALYYRSTDSWVELPRAPSAVRPGGDFDVRTNTYYTMGLHGLLSFDIRSGTWTERTTDIDALSHGPLAFVPGAQGGVFVSGGQNRYGFARVIRDVTWGQTKPMGGSILTNRTKEVEVTVDADGLAEATYEAGIRVRSNDPDRSAVTIPLTIVVGAPSLSVQPAVLDPGEVFVGFPRVITLELANDGTLPLTVQAIDVSGSSAVTIGNFPSTVDPGTVVGVDVTVAPLAPGPVEAQLTIMSDDDEHPQLVVPFTAQAALPPEVRIAPAALVAALPPTSSTLARRALSIANAGQGTLRWNVRVSSVDPTTDPPPSWIAIEPSDGEVEPGGTATLTVTLSSTEFDTGDLAATIALLTNDPATPSVEVPITLHVGEIDLAGFAIDLRSRAGENIAVVRLEVPSPLDAREIVVDTVRLSNSVVPIAALGTGDANQDGIPERILAFDLNVVYDLLGRLGSHLSVVGEVRDTTWFTGETTLRRRAISVVGEPPTEDGQDPGPLDMQRR